MFPLILNFVSDFSESNISPLIQSLLQSLALSLQGLLFWSLSVSVLIVASYEDWSSCFVSVNGVEACFVVKLRFDLNKKKGASVSCVASHAHCWITCWRSSSRWIYSNPITPSAAFCSVNFCLFVVFFLSCWFFSFIQTQCVHNSHEYILDLMVHWELIWSLKTP